MKAIIVYFIFLATALSLKAASVISVDFYQDGGGWMYHECPTTSGTGDLHLKSVGVVPVVGTNWNISQASSASPSTASESGLKDHLGSATTMGFTASGSYVYRSGTINSGTYGVTGEDLKQAQANLRLLNTQLGTNGATPVTINITDIPYAAYEIIVYLGGTDADNRKGKLTLGGASFYYLTASSSSFQANPSFIQATATTDSGVSVANYASFSNLTGSSQTISLEKLGNNVGITAFQVVEIVPIPEPTSSVLLGLAGMGFLVRRKRK